MSLPWIYRNEAVGLKSCKYTLKSTIYVSMWNVEYDMLLITAQLKFKFQNAFAHVWYM